MVKIKVDINECYDEIEILVTAPKVDEEVQMILDNLNKKEIKHVIGIKDERMYIINPKEVFCFYTYNKKVMLSTNDEEYEIKEKLYEVEEYFRNESFLRISKSVIANVDKIKNLDVFFNGTLCVTFINGKQEYVSRKYVSNLKKYLKIGVK